MHQISEKDLQALCDIARALNNADEEDPDLFDLWEQLNDVIQNIK
jgi:hypothetical protein